MQREKVVAHYAAFREKIKDFAFFFFLDDTAPVALSSPACRWEREGSPRGWVFPSRGWRDFRATRLQRPNPTRTVLLEVPRVSGHCVPGFSLSEGRWDFPC